MGGRWNGGGMIPPRKFTYVEPPKETSAIHVRPNNLQRMKERLEAIKGVPKLASFRRVEG